MDNQVPIGMLVTSIKNHGNDLFEIFGFWYYKELGLPATKQEKKGFFGDLMTERCCQVSIKGSSRQVEEIISFAYVNFPESAGEEKETQNKIISMFNFLRNTPNGFYPFDDLMDPKGTALPLDITVRVDEDFNSLKKKILSKPDVVELRIEREWSLLKDMFNLE